LSGDCRDRVKESFKSYLEEPRNFSFEPSLIHDDLSSDHILHDSKEHVITGVIDWGDSVFGDPAFDYTGLLNDYGFEFSQLVLKLVGHPPEYLDRAYFYSTLIPLYRALYYIEIGERDNLEDSLKTIATVFHP
jgi:aminoglycoside 2''-phosphotransferase